MIKIISLVPELHLKCYRNPHPALPTGRAVFYRLFSISSHVMVLRSPNVQPYNHRSVAGQKIKKFLKIFQKGVPNRLPSSLLYMKEEDDFYEANDFSTDHHRQLYRDQGCYLHAESLRHRRRSVLQQHAAEQDVLGNLFVFHFMKGGHGCRCHPR